MCENIPDAVRKKNTMTWKQCWFDVECNQHVDFWGPLWTRKRHVNRQIIDIGVESTSVSNRHRCRIDIVSMLSCRTAEPIRISELIYTGSDKWLTGLDSASLNSKRTAFYSFKVLRKDFLQRGRFDVDFFIWQIVDRLFLQTQKRRIFFVAKNMNVRKARIFFLQHVGRPCLPLTVN